MYQCNKLSDTCSIQAWKEAYLKKLTGPMHAYWQHGLIGGSDHYLLLAGEEKIGYFCLSEKTLMQLFLTEKVLPQGTAVLDYLIETHGLGDALAATIEPWYLSLCLDRAKTSSVHSLLYEDHHQPESKPSGLGTLRFEEADMDNFDLICEHYSRTSDDGELSLDNMKAYIQSVIDEHHIFMLFSDDQLIATSECRISADQPPWADLGMIVHPEFRRRGIGSHILILAKAYCYEQQTKPIACCEAENIGSMRAIEKAGFFKAHRVLQTKF